MPEIPSYCRLCVNGCPVLVEVVDGRAVRLTGDPSNDMYHGYTCVKGRATPLQMNNPDRLLSSQKRMDDGTFRPISSEQLLDEVAERMRDLIDRNGPKSIASYFGTMAANVSALTMPITRTFLDALGSPWHFNPDTIDQAGKQVARALHGTWLAPSQGFDEPDVGLVVGANPLVTYAGGLPFGNPGHALKTWLERGYQLIVVDPRRSDLAKRATIHLQARPGEDVAILAALLRVIIDEDLYDHEFVAENVAGLDRMREVVASFTPAEVARRADIDPDDLVRAARIFAAAPRGFACAGTGPNMAGPGTLVEYLILSLNTVCGRWLRAGEKVRTPTSVLAPMPLKAQAQGPYAGVDIYEALPGSGLRGAIGGPPIAGLPDAILHDGEDRIRMLLSIGGNPAVAWPDQLKVIEALRSLELLVQMDIVMSATAQLADYIVAPRMALESPSLTVIQDALSLYAPGYMGYSEPWAQYTDVVVEPPPGSDVLAEWELLYGLAQRLGLQLEIGSRLPWVEEPPRVLDMTVKPDVHDLLELMVAGSRVPLAEIKQHPHGAVFPDPPVFVPPRDPDCTERLDVGNESMMGDLERIAAAASTDVDGEPGRETLGFRLICRRSAQVANSAGRDVLGRRGRTYNPAFLNPSDLAALGLAAGDLAEIRSARASVTAVVEPDDTLRPGLVSMTHAFGDLPEREGDVRDQGTNTGRLLVIDDEIQPYTGQPRMSNVPVSVTAAR